MKIERINKGSWGKVRAFFDLTTTEGFTIKGFKIIEGINGLFVSMPSQKGSDGEYYDTIWMESKELRESVNKLALDSYGTQADNNLNAGIPNTAENVAAESNPDPVPDSTATPIESNAEKDTAESFGGDDDIPF
tara:strand:+ start:1264 stop:1665 length:402 start_codon:yes stop_codon:yes gene_type:complete